MKKFFWVLFSMIIMSISVNAAPSSPKLSLNSGFYPSGQLLEIEGEGDIFYTLNGDVPSERSNRYTMPIELKENIISPSSIQGYVAQEQTPKATVVRAAAISGGEMSGVVSKVYFVGDNVHGFYNLPIINLTIDTKDLWDRNTGIYTNYNYEHNVPAVFQYFNNDGILEEEREVEVKVSGHGSRTSAKKSIRIFFTKGDVSKGKYIDCDIIPNARMNYENPNPVTRFYKLTMRISDWAGTNLRDVLAQKIGSFTRADVAASSPASLFLNGEFWGMYECREQYDERYVRAHYGIDDDDVVFLDRDWTLAPQRTVLDGEEYTDKIEYNGPKDGNSRGFKGESYYRNQWLYVRSLAETKDIAKAEIYEEFCSLVDIDNYIDYIIVYIYCANDDWPGNNFKLWRIIDEKIDSSTYGADGKWRFMIHDFDIAFEDVNHDTLYLSALQKGDVSDARHPEYATKMLGCLLKNEDFRNAFAQRLMAYLSTAMSEENIGRLVDGLVEERKEGKMRDLLRWNLGYGSSVSRLNQWLSNVDSFKKFAARRPDALTGRVINILNGEPYFAGISGKAVMSFNCTDAHVSIDGANISEERYRDKAKDFRTIQFAGIPIRIEAFDQNGSVAKITVTHDNLSEVFYGTAKFTVQEAQYEIYVEAQ